MSAQRFDIYTKVHKGLRKALFDLSYTAGRTDYENEHELSQLRELCMEVVLFLNKHAYNEDTYQLPLLEAKAPGSTQHDTDEHEIIDGMIHQVVREMAALHASRVSDRKERGEAFYHSVNSFISKYLIHMRDEELETAPMFRMYVTDEELEAAFRKFIGNMSPEESARASRYIIPSIDASERLELLRGMKATAPPQTFDGIMELAREVLDAHEVDQLFEELHSRSEREALAFRSTTRFSDMMSSIEV